MGQGIIIGVDLGGTKVACAAVDPNGHIVAQDRSETLAQQGPGAVIGRIARLVSEVADKAGAPVHQLDAISIGVAGSVDGERGIVNLAPNLPGWRKVQLVRLLHEQLNATPPVVLENDVDIAVVGEHAYGVGRGLQSMIGVFVGTGIGGALILDGRLYRGQRSSAGELGHTRVRRGGPRCRCGQRGCVEVLASRTAMERDVRALIDRGHKSSVLKLMKKRGELRMTSSIIQRALADDDPVMRRVFRRAQRYIGALCANLVNTLDPQLVLIGGGIAERMGEDMVARIREVAYDEFFLQLNRELVRIVPTELKGDAAPLGAAWLARQRLSLSPEAGRALH
jgi:glucokinase